MTSESGNTQDVLRLLRVKDEERWFVVGGNYPGAPLYGPFTRADLDEAGIEVDTP